MSRIFVTGDIHRTRSLNKLFIENFTEQKNLTKDDILIVTGDFGAPWTYGEDEIDKRVLDFHNARPYTTVFCDGNHENFDALKTYPIVTYNGAKCHQLRPSVYHPLRGEIMNVDDHNIWFFGGAKSLDIDSRLLGLTWWPDELPSTKEEDEGLLNLLDHDADIIITHDGPRVVIDLETEIGNVDLWPGFKPEESFRYFLEHTLTRCHKYDITLKHWYFGHYHRDIDFDIEVYNDEKEDCYMVTHFTEDEGLEDPADGKIVSFHMMYDRIVEIK